MINQEIVTCYSHARVRRRVLCRLSALFLAGSVQNVGLAQTQSDRIHLRGAGATLATRLFEAWGARLMADTGQQLTYASVGSTQGLTLFQDRDLDFAASEIRLANDDIAEKRLMQFPVASASIALHVNLPGVSQAIRLTPALVSAIYRGEVRYWRHPEIARLNANRVLPDLAITPVSRLGSSGSTYSLSRYLTMSDGAWAQELGMVDRADWDYGLLAKGALELQEVVTSTPGAIGYWLFDPLSRGSTVHVQLGYPELGFVDPPSDSSTLGLWPLTTTVYVVVRVPNPLNGQRGTAVIRFFERALTQWQQTTRRAGYVPLDADRLAVVMAIWQRHGLLNGAVR